LNEDLVDEVSDILNDNQAMIKTDAFKMEIQKLQAEGKKGKSGKEIRLSPIQRKYFDDEGREICKGRNKKDCEKRLEKWRKEQEKREEKWRKEEEKREKEWEKEREEWEKKRREWEEKNKEEEDRDDDDRDDDDDTKPEPRPDNDTQPDDGKRFLSVLRSLKDDLLISDRDGDKKPSKKELKKWEKNMSEAAKKAWKEE